MFSMPDLDTDVRILDLESVGEGWDWLAKVFADV
jgi:hypothetical protein